MADISNTTITGAGTAALHSPGATRGQLVSAFVAYIDALEARVASLEAQTTNSAPLTAAEAAAYARVNVETIRRAIRTGLLPTTGAVGRSPRIAREALDAWIAQKSPRPEASPPRTRRARGRTSPDAIDAAWRELE
jgi:excisionase family DNA binding protein